MMHAFFCAQLCSSQREKVTHREKMSEGSQEQSEHSSSSISSDDCIEELICEELHGPLEVKIQAKIEARLQGQLAGSSSQLRIHTQRYVLRDREGANDRLHSYYFL